MNLARCRKRTVAGLGILLLLVVATPAQAADALGPPAMQIGLSDRRWTWRQVFAWRRFPDRHRLDPIERTLYEQRWTTPVLPSNARHALKLAF